MQLLKGRADQLQSCSDHQKPSSDAARPQRRARKDEGPLEPYLVAAGGKGGVVNGQILQKHALHLGVLHPIHLHRQYQRSLSPGDIDICALGSNMLGTAPECQPLHCRTHNPL